MGGGETIQRDRGTEKKNWRNPWNIENVFSTDPGGAIENSERGVDPELPLQGNGLMKEKNVGKRAIGEKCRFPPGGLGGGTGGGEKIRERLRGNFTREKKITEHGGVRGKKKEKKKYKP